MEILVKNSQRSISIDKVKIERLTKKIIRYMSKNPSFEFLKNVEMSILFVSDKKMKELNLNFRGKDKTTDVLSFPQYSMEEIKKGRSKIFQASPLLGDIVINLQQAKRQAEERKISLYEEVYQLLIHGFLHLIGYDHEKNKYHERKMKRLEKELLEATR